jgi:hypothetical protein
VASYAYTLRAHNIFACQAGGYASGRFIVICDAENYGEYEKGAFWFDLEPTAERSAANADVLFLGDSRMQFAFSTDATKQWFSSASASYYLLGFIAFENSIFTQALLPKLKPRAELYVIGISDFFQPFETPTAKIIMHDGAARDRYKLKRLLQVAHKAICGKISAICGHRVVVFRSPQTGTWYMPKITALRGRERPVSYDQQIDQREVDNAIAVGRIFLSELPVKPECVILTSVPTVGTKVGTANAIARGLGKVLVVPERLDALQTFDGVHLDQASAELWSGAFLKAAGPQVHKCLDDHESP